MDRRCLGGSKTEGPHTPRQEEGRGVMLGKGEQQPTGMDWAFANHQHGAGVQPRGQARAQHAQGPGFKDQYEETSNETRNKPATVKKQPGTARGALRTSFSTLFPRRVQSTCLCCVAGKRWLSSHRAGSPMSCMFPLSYLPSPSSNKRTDASGHPSGIY